MTKTETETIYYEQFRVFFPLQSFYSIFVNSLIYQSDYVVKHIANIDTCADFSDYNIIFFVRDSPDRRAAVIW